MKLSDQTKDIMYQSIGFVSFWLMIILLLSGGFYLMNDRMKKANEEKVVYTQPIP